MANVVVVERRCDCVGPVFKFGCIDLDNRSAQPARQVVVVRVDDASTIETLASVGHDHVDIARFDESLQLRVHGGQSDLATIFDNQLVQILGTDEATDPT